MIFELCDQKSSRKQKRLQAIFACSYGAQVESFRQKKLSKISWHCPFKEAYNLYIKIIFQTVLFVQSCDLQYQYWSDFLDQCLVLQYQYGSDFLDQCLPVVLQYQYWSDFLDQCLLLQYQYWSDFLDQCFTVLLIILNGKTIRLARLLCCLVT